MHSRKAVSDFENPGMFKVYSFSSENEQLEFYKKQLDHNLKNDAFCAYRRKFIVDNFDMDKVSQITRHTLELDRDYQYSAIQSQTLKAKPGFSLCVDNSKGTNLFGRVSQKTQKLTHMFQIFKDRVDVRGVGSNNIASFKFIHPIQAVWFILDFVEVYTDWTIKRDQFGNSYVINYDNPAGKMTELEIILYIIGIFNNGGRYVNPVIYQR